MLVNLTPHSLTIYVDGEVHLTIGTSGMVARCEEQEKFIGKTYFDIPVWVSTFGEVVGLPEKEPGKAFIVSALVGNALKGTRDDLFVPGKAIRDENGRQIGCEGLKVVR